MNQKSEQQIDNAYNLFLKSTSRQRVDCAGRAAKFALAELSSLIQQALYCYQQFTCTMCALAVALQPSKLLQRDEQLASKSTAMQ